ncbi:hypothetical protein ABMA28_002136 [Loxostege sticticalis]|uniref:Uncharacterized protein n=1 Tax=Loxostege sticticalis TaxID=481309 RepID=A0ABD0SZX6_LOXSC
MNSKSLWMFLLILQCGIVTPRPSRNQREKDLFAHQQYNYDAHNKPKDNNEEQVISVRITSSVAVGRSGPKNDFKNIEHIKEEVQQNNFPTSLITAYPTKSTNNEGAIETVTSEVPPNLIGANIEFIRQLNAKKEARSHHTSDHVHSLQSNQYTHENENSSKLFINAEEDKLKTKIKINTQVTSELNFENQDEDSVAEPSIKTLLGISEKSYNYESISFPESSSHIQVNKKDESGVTSLAQSQSHKVDNESIFTKQSNETDDSIAASSIESILTRENDDQKSDENLENVPLARSVSFSPSSKNYIRGRTNKPPSERGNSASLTTVSFNILHETPNQPANYNIPSNTYTHSDQGFSASNKFYETPKVYSQPAKIYSEPSKFYSEPAKIYSEPAKIYSEPAKVYSEPAKIYSEPAKFYSQPASLHLPPESLPNYTPWQEPSQHTDITTTTLNTTPTTVNTLPTSIDSSNTQKSVEQNPEQNYEIDESISVMTDGRSHSVQESTTEKCKQDNCKVGYVVEGRQYKKYRVEERTPDGFIVGEYGVVRNEDGALRGVRYTADSDASPRLIYDALMKFLQLK